MRNVGRLRNARPAAGRLPAATDWYLRYAFVMTHTITAAAATLLLAALSASAWTDKGHKMLPELALKQLPPEVPILGARAAAVIDGGPEPDRWRSGRPPIKDAQEPDHFINLERAAFLAAFPPTRHKFIEAVYAEAARSGSGLRPEAIGYQPYIVAEIFERLRVSFGHYIILKLLEMSTTEAEERIAFYAGWLSHYVADGSQPLHATIHYDGWIGDNPQGFVTARGIHHKFEGQFVEDNLGAADIAAIAPKSAEVGDLMADYMAYLRQSAGLVRRLYELEKAGAFDGAGTPEGRRFVTERLAAGRDMLAAVWLAAWRQAQWSGCVPYTAAPAKVSQVGCVMGTVVATSSPSTGATAPAAGPVYLNFCEDFRTCELGVQIPASARSRFPDPATLKGKMLRFYGMVSTSGGRPVMYVSDPRLMRSQ